VACVALFDSFFFVKEISPIKNLKAVFFGTETPIKEAQSAWVKQSVKKITWPKGPVNPPAALAGGFWRGILCGRNLFV